MLIADDEVVARQRLRRLLAGFDRVEVVGEAGDGHAAIRLVRSVWPDLVFLDIQMPKGDGFDVIREIGPARMPFVVFVTAFDEHAITAFEVSAIDYLLKPFDSERFEEAFRRAEARIDADRNQEKTRQLLDVLGVAEGESERGPASRIMVKSRGRIRFIDVTDVTWIEASGNYVRVHLGDTSHLVRETLARIERRLEPGSFARIHRGALVNLQRVKEMSHWSSGEYQVEMDDGTTLKLSRTYRDGLLRNVLGRG